MFSLGIPASSQSPKTYCHQVANVLSVDEDKQSEFDSYLQGSCKWNCHCVTKPLDRYTVVQVFPGICHLFTSQKITLHVLRFDIGFFQFALVSGQYSQSQFLIFSSNSNSSRSLRFTAVAESTSTGYLIFSMLDKSYLQRVPVQYHHLPKSVLQCFYIFFMPNIFFLNRL